MATYEGLLEPLCHTLFAAGAVALQARDDLERNLKPDGSIVTNGDVEVERFLRETLEPLVPGTAFWGEESGFEAPADSGIWLVDPIDGTSNFSYGSPLWGISVALVIDNVIEVGGVLLPDLNEIYLAARGHGTFLNGEPLEPIPAGPIRPETLVSYTSSVERAIPSERIPGKRRDLGAFVISGAFVATQRLRGLIGMYEKLYDCAACILIAEELGADVVYADGSPFEIAPLLADVKIEKPWLIFPRDAGFRLS